ncbi:CRAL-TRIO domain-containing protein [Daedaleopsis nitida]|nr:CRAL-TRIO domain-containing protein [Daedaleopsis nitida]
MSARAALQEKQELLAEIYQTNVAGARALQRTLERDILPGLVDELGLDGHGEERAKTWLNDFQSVFRLLRRHKFTVPFALENARDLLVWRLAVIPDVIPRPTTPFLRCLPQTARDPFHRPILVVQLSRLLEVTEDVRTTLIYYMELLRLNLEAVNDAGRADREDQPVLQYVALVDIGGISVQSVQNVDIISWFIYELVPRFPGMLAAVFILNYSWTHSGVWNIVKRVLPKSALSRVFFPSQDELLEYFPPSAIPREYGGSLPKLTSLEDPLENFMEILPESAPPTSPAIPPPTSADQPSSPYSSTSAKPISRVPSISPTSHLNPYFGYPVSGRGAPVPRLRHGRQRKRDLLRTLAALWWSKWKPRVVLFLCVLLAIVSYRLRRTPACSSGGRASVGCSVYRLGHDVQYLPIWCDNRNIVPCRTFIPWEARQEAARAEDVRPTTSQRHSPRRSRRAPSTACRCMICASMPVDSPRGLVAREDSSAPGTRPASSEPFAKPGGAHPDRCASLAPDPSSSDTGSRVAHRKYSLSPEARPTRARSD